MKMRSYFCLDSVMPWRTRKIVLQSEIATVKSSGMPDSKVRKILLRKGIALLKVINKIIQKEY